MVPYVAPASRRASDRASPPGIVLRLHGKRIGQPLAPGSGGLPPFGALGSAACVGSGGHNYKPYRRFNRQSRCPALARHPLNAVLGPGRVDVSNKQRIAT